MAMRAGAGCAFVLTGGRGRRYTKNGVTIMIDAGYNYARLREKMGWLDIDPAAIRHILITHQDTDPVGALETDSEQLFRDATVYIGEIENRYLTG